MSRLLRAEYQAITGELRYHPADQWLQEFADLKAFMRRAFQVLTYNGIDGDYAEFGCCGARTFTLAWGAARLVGHPAHHWAFDSFEGLPPTTDPRDEHQGWVAGAMAMTEDQFVRTCLARGLRREEFTTVPGFYEQSLVEGDSLLPERVAFAYIDCDLYSSTREVLGFLSPRLCQGAVIAFDDYYCYSPSLPSGERLAAGEFFGPHDRWCLLPYVQWGWYGMSFIVEERTAINHSPVGW